jgi:TetR/AcrR family transcriptional regulator, mexJK operon transcriptional repressor
MTDGLIVRIDGGAAPPAVARKRTAIVEAATRLFLRQGYDVTRIDQVAADAGVSKQTVYNQFGDKESLFHVIVLGATTTADQFVDGLPSSFDAVPDVEFERELYALARRYLAIVAAPPLLAMRRLIVAEATRFPELAARYYEKAPARVMTAFAELFARLGARGLLTVPDAAEAATHFAFLLVGATMDRGLLHPAAPAAPAWQLTTTADSAVRVFLAAYRPA